MIDQTMSACDWLMTEYKTYQNVHVHVPNLFYSSAISTRINNILIIIIAVQLLINDVSYEMFYLFIC